MKFLIKVIEFVCSVKVIEFACFSQDYRVLETLTAYRVFEFFPAYRVLVISSAYRVYNHCVLTEFGHHNLVEFDTLCCLPSLNDILGKVATVSFQANYTLSFIE